MFHQASVDGDFCQPSNAVFSALEQSGLVQRSDRHVLQNIFAVRCAQPHTGDDSLQALQFGE
jgi:hypothetical protein